MIDFKFEEIACWVGEVVDPVAFENWVGNKLLGLEVEENKMWEKAFNKWERKNLKGATDKETLELILDGQRPEGVVTLEGLGTLVCPVGKASQAEIKIGKEKIVVESDTILVYPVGLGENKKAEVKFKGELKIDKKNKLEIEVNGGKVGLVIDTRGRPLVLPTVDSLGRERLLKWQKALI